MLGVAFLQQRMLLFQDQGGLLEMVKSTYKVAQKCLKESSHKADAGSASENDKMRSPWNLIWKLKCLNKIKQFMWRSYRDILPTKHRLKARGILIEDDCEQCGMNESAGHVLWGCKLTAEVLGASRL